MSENPVESRRSKSVKLKGLAPFVQCSQDIFGLQHHWKTFTLTPFLHSSCWVSGVGLHSALLLRSVRTNLLLIYKIG